MESTANMEDEMKQGGAAEDGSGENEIVMDSVDEAKDRQDFITTVKCIDHLETRCSGQGKACFLKLLH